MRKHYASRIRALKQFQHEPGKDRRRFWFLVPVLIVSVLLIIYRDSLPRNWSDYENLLLPVSIILVLIFAVALWLLPKAYVRSIHPKYINRNRSDFDREKESLKLEDDTRKTLAQIVGGGVFLLGIIFTYNTFVLNRDGQITDRFTKAVAQLGDDDIAVRLGGLYALERIAKDSPKDHGTIMEIISAYIREKSQPAEPVKAAAPINANTNQSKKAETEKIKTDIQTALTIIGRRDVKEGGSQNQIDLSGTHIPGAYLRSANLTNTTLANADLNHADLTEANLNRTHLVRVNLSGANLMIANLSHANLTDSNLRYADLQDTTLSEAIFSFADLSFANLGYSTLFLASFENTKLFCTNLRGADIHATFSLSYEQLAEGIVDEKTKLPKRWEERRQELINTSKQNIEKCLNEALKNLDR